MIGISGCPIAREARVGNDTRVKIQARALRASGMTPPPIAKSARRE
jgi:hypothetical protein